MSERTISNPDSNPITGAEIGAGLEPENDNKPTKTSKHK
jgi:hypothetical protein